MANDNSQLSADAVLKRDASQRKSYQLGVDPNTAGSPGMGLGERASIGEGTSIGLIASEDIAAGDFVVWDTTGDDAYKAAPVDGTDRDGDVGKAGGVSPVAVDHSTTNKAANLFQALVEGPAEVTVKGAVAKGVAKVSVSDTDGQLSDDAPSATIGEVRGIAITAEKTATAAGLVTCWLSNPVVVEGA